MYFLSLGLNQQKSGDEMTLEPSASLRPHEMRHVRTFKLGPHRGRSSLLATLTFAAPPTLADLLARPDRDLLGSFHLFALRFVGSHPGSLQNDDQGETQAGQQQHQAEGQQGVEQDGGVLQDRRHRATAGIRDASSDSHRWCSSGQSERLSWRKEWIRDQKMSMNLLGRMISTRNK